MLACFYIPRLSNDIKITVQKNHLWAQMLYRKFGKNGVNSFSLLQSYLTVDFRNCLTFKSHCIVTGSVLEPFGPAIVAVCGTRSKDPFISVINK